MHVPYSSYESNEMKRKMVPNWYKQPGCHSQPLFDIPLDRIVIDELHLMLRVMDRLEQGLILEVVDWDEVNFLVLNNTEVQSNAKKVYTGMVFLTLSA